MLQTNGNQADGYMRANVDVDPRHFVSFVAKNVLNEAQSKQEGRPVFEVLSYFRLERAGERDVLMREATAADKSQYPEAWRAFEEKREQRPNGTPLAVLFPAHPEIVATLEYFKTYTVEQLARISDTSLQTIGLGGREWQNKAIAFLKAAEGAQGFHILKNEIETAQATIAKQAEQIKAMEATLASKQQPATPAGGFDPNMIASIVQQQVAAAMDQQLVSKRRGRPPKVQPEQETE